MSSSECRWGRSRWPTSPASTSAGTATRTGSRISATRSARSTAGARRRAPASTIMTTSAARRRRRWSRRSSRISAPRQGVERREISDQEIVERTLYTMVNEGAKILEEGMAQRASDIDVVWVYGYGWPVYRGGPMFWADTEGLRQDRRGPEAPGSAHGRATSASRSCCSTRPRRARSSPADGLQQGDGDERLHGHESTGQRGGALSQDRHVRSTGSPPSSSSRRSISASPSTILPRGTPNGWTLFAWHKTIGRADPAAGVGPAGRIG